MLLRIRSRDGLERVKIDNPYATVAELKFQIESQLQVNNPSQTLSTNQNLLLAKTLDDMSRFSDMSNPHTPLSYINLTHGSIVYLAYEGERTVPGGPTVSPAGSFGKKMTMDDLIAKQMRVTPQEKPHCELVSFDHDAANTFLQYASTSLSFAVKRGGFMYGTVSPEGKVEVDFIYEPPQQGTEETLIVSRNPEEERIVEAIATGLGMKRVGFIFTQTKSQNKKDYTMSNAEILQSAELQGESDLKEWVTAIVKMEGDQVHFEAFQMSDMCVRLLKEGWFEKDITKGADPKISKMKKEVIVGGKDTKEVDNHFFLVVVKILQHQGPLSIAFPVENRNAPLDMRALKTHMDRTKSLPFVKRISDFHLLLFVCRFLDANADVVPLADCVRTQTVVPEGFQMLIDSLAETS